ncbi:hypothetical protein CVT24_013155 [Panaeolus cyanescens]|uniref:Uncharacterized protein n=1 Tax=Panaeolus cyanescens TaxID=181874 RepID=A0A409WA35_9AGAR|nr:hypothetical protein CVT24_013155 [Panaeolus cyanescens]
MSGATPSLIPKDPFFPLLLPQPPQPHPVPLPPLPKYGYVNGLRDLQRQLDELSDEENELEDLNLAVRNRGFNFLIPIGRNLTRQEEKNDAEEDSDDDSVQDGVSPTDEGENDESGHDLDADMEDLDEEISGDTEDNDEMNEGDTEEYEEEPSDII